MYGRIFKICSVIIAILGSSFLTIAQPSEAIVEEENIYKKVPDIQLQTESGTFPLSDIYSQSPVIIAMVFTRCTGICSPFIFQLAEHIEKLRPKEKFKIIVVSFDPRDSLANMIEFGKRFRLPNKNQWIFAKNNQIEQLNNISNFHPVWNDSSQQYDHDALLVGVNTNGYITKKLLGLRDERALSTVIREINNRQVLSYPVPGKETLLSCFRYDPATGERKPSYGLLFLLLPAAFGATILFVFSRMRKHYEKTNQTLD